MPISMLVADDSLYARLVVKNVVMDALGEAVFSEATSGSEAIELAEAREFLFDCYLLDINMAGKDGIQVAEHLLESGVAPETIALVTGNHSRDLKLRASELGLRYIEKALSPADLEPFQLRVQGFLKGLGHE
ncbi:MAG: response regulator transcription factor [Oceanobacter sp.]